MKTLREYIDQLDEISRRDFLKGAGVAALGAAGGISADRFLKSQQNNKIVLPDDPTVYYLLGYLWGFSYLFPYNKTIESWLKKMGPYIGEVTLKIQSSGRDQLTQAYDNGFSQARNDVKKTQTSGLNDQQTADDFARYWESSYKKLLSKLNLQEEELDEAGNPDAVRRIEQLVQYK